MQRTPVSSIYIKYLILRHPIKILSSGVILTVFVRYHAESFDLAEDRLVQESIQFFFVLPLDSAQGTTKKNQFDGFLKSIS